MNFNITTETFKIEEFVKVFEISYNKVAILDHNYRIKYANKEFVKAFHRESNEFMEKDFFQIQKTDNILNDHRDVIRKTLITEEKWIGEVEWRTEKGVNKLDKVTIATITSNEKEIKFYVVVVDDITDYKSVSLDLKKCEEHYDCVFKQNHLITMMIDPNNGDIIDANEVACNFYGYKDSEFKRKNISEINISSKQEVLKKLMDTARHDNLLYIESPGEYFKHRLANGEVRDVEVFSGFVCMFERDMIYIVVHDISDRKRAESLIRESEERYRLLVELSPDAIVVYSNGLVLFANEQASLKLGMKNPLELVGRKVLDFVHPDSLDIVKIRMHTAEVKGEVLPLITHKLIKLNGEVLHAEILGAPLIYEGKKAIQIVIRDITERIKEIERAIKIQQHRQELSFSLQNKVNIRAIYVPAKILSGDFYLYHKVSDDIAIGFLGDVTGKGITAALNISAMKVIFNEAASNINNPFEIIKHMNREVQRHLGEDYVSCCCFEINFKTGILNIVGAGINEFIHISKDGIWNKVIVEGPPLGMFEDINFEQIQMSFSKGDVFNFYSDGMDFIFNYEELSTRYRDLVHDELKTYLLEQINNSPQLQDDCTWLSLKIL